MDKTNVMQQEPENIFSNQGLTPAEAVDSILLQGSRADGIAFPLPDRNEQSLQKKAYEKLLREVEKGIASGYVDEDAALRRLEVV